MRLQGRVYYSHTDWHDVKYTNMPFTTLRDCFAIIEAILDIKYIVRKVEVDTYEKNGVDVRVTHRKP